MDISERELEQEEQVLDHMVLVTVVVQATVVVDMEVVELMVGEDP